MCLICVCSSFFFLIIKRIKYIYNKKCSTIKEKVNLLIDGFENCLNCERSSRFIPLQMQLGRLLSFLFQRNESKKISKFEPSLSPVSSWERFNTTRNRNLSSDCQISSVYQLRITSSKFRSFRNVNIRNPPCCRWIQRFHTAEARKSKEAGTSTKLLSG